MLVKKDNKYWINIIKWSNNLKEKNGKKKNKRHSFEDKESNKFYRMTNFSKKIFRNRLKVMITCTFKAHVNDFNFKFFFWW